MGHGPAAAAPAPTHDAAFTLRPLGQGIEALGREWRQLEPHADASFFQSWSWIGCWLRHLPADVAPLVLRATAANRTVALAILVPRTVWRRGLVRARQLHLAETGRRSRDALTIEHNGFLADRRTLPDAERQCIEWLARSAAWDELHLPGIDGRLLQAVADSPLRLHVKDRKPAYAVDLGRLRQAGGDVASLLSPGTRYQLRRSGRLYARAGPLRIVEAATVGEALAILDELKLLHQRSWQKRGRPGAFAAPGFEAFHRDLVAACLGRGEIQLLRVSAGAETVGCLYNFRHAGRISCYQSGLRCREHAAFKPGLLCHAMAIEWNMQRGAAVYDLLAGDNQLKRSLATERTQMTWAVVQRDRLRFRVEAWGRRIAAERPPSTSTPQG